MPGYAEPKTARLSEIRIVTQTMIGGSADIGESDPPTVLSAAEAGAQFKIVGKPYDSTSLVFVVNGDRVKTLADLAKPETRVAIGARGDITHVILAAPLLKRGIGIEKMTLLELPGSGTRLSALLSGRIDVGSLHFDQAESIMDKGNFKILIEPWKELAGWTNEVWVVRTEWLRKPENERALTDFLKANIIAFRRANTDFDWYLESFRKYVTLKDADKMTAATLRPIWEKLRNRDPGVAGRRQLLGGRDPGDASGVQGGRCDSRHGQGRRRRRDALPAAGAEGARLTASPVRAWTSPEPTPPCPQSRSPHLPA